MSKEIFCAGCGITAEQAGYSEDDPVEEDGTFANNAFVCDSCYCKLIVIGQDVGSPEKLQREARLLNNKSIKSDFDMQCSHVTSGTKPCPVCGTTDTQPYPGCNCRDIAGHHIMKYHHKCSGSAKGVSHENA